MRRGGVSAAVAAALIASSALAASQDAGPRARPAARATRTPIPPAGIRSAEDDAAPTPTPTPVLSHRLVAALEVEQGDGGERTAVFEDGTLVRVVRLGARVTTSRRSVSREELEVISRVVAEALSVSDDAERRSFVLAEEARRRFRLEVGDGGKVREFRFDDVTALPLAVGRARAALEDLRARFIVKPVDKHDMWDADDVKEGDLLKRRGDGRWFRVVRDDAFENNLEVQEVGHSGIGQFLKRGDLPKVFEDPGSIDPGEAPR